MRGYQQAPGVHEPKNMSDDSRIPTSTQNT